jgi:hypothetical protein
MFDKTTNLFKKKPLGVDQNGDIIDVQLEHRPEVVQNMAINFLDIKSKLERKF